jgi:hypothetical protein
MYPLIVITTPFGTRGVDYRAPNTGIALVIDDSFPHERAAV